MWLDDHLHEGPSRYLESWVYRVDGPLDLDAVRWTLTRLAERHEALRTTVILRDDELVQVVADPVEVQLQVLSCLPDALLAEELRRLVSRPLDIEAMAWRASVLTWGPQHHVLVLQVHHALVDDWALAVLDEEFSQAYTERVTGQAADLPDLPLQLGDYALAQRAAGVGVDVVAYWRERLQGISRDNASTGDRVPTAGARHGDQVRFHLDVGRAQLIRASARRWRTTPFTVLLSALGVLLSRHRGVTDLIIGTPISRRGSAGFDRVIGCLTDLLPLRQLVMPDQSFSGLVGQNKEIVREAIAYRSISYAEVQRLVAPRRNPGMARLCETVLVVDDANRVPLRLPGARTERIYVPSGIAKFDLCLTLVADQGQYLGLLDYATDVFNRGQIERIAEEFRSLLDELLDNAG